MLKEIINIEHNNLSHQEVLVKNFYLNELCRLNKDFDAKLRNLINENLDKCNLPKQVSLKDFTQEEILDITNPIK